MSNNVKFSHGDKSYDIGFNLVNNPSEKTVKVNGNLYQILGSEESIEAFKIQFEKLGTTEFQSFADLEMSLKKIGKPEGSKQEKTDAVFQKTIVIEEKNAQKIDIPSTVKEIGEKLEQYYIFPETAKKCSEYLHEQLSNGAYKSNDREVLCKALTHDLQKISQDGHMRIGISDLNSFDDVEPSLPSTKELNGPYSLPELKEPVIEYKTKDPYLPYEFRSGLLEEDPTVGYIDIRDLLNCSYLGDKPTEGPKYKEMMDFEERKRQLIDAANKLKDAKTILIDLRNCGGGHSTGVQLMSSLFVDKESPLTRVEWRDGDSRTFTDVNTLSNEELPQDQRLLNKKVMILTGPKTYSAAEAFINDMRVLEKAVTVGEKTGGGANSGKEWYPIGDFEIYIPEGEAIHPKQRERGESNWEGVGIQPDHLVPAEDALQAAIELSQKKNS